jgi:Tol biopolymer transport system component
VISQVAIQWGAGWDSVNNIPIVLGGKDYELQAWTGYNWVTLKKVIGNDQQYNQLGISPPYRTDQLRIAISSTTDPTYSKYVQINEVNISKDVLVQPNSYADLGLWDQRFNYTVSAVDRYGFESPTSPVEAIVGDVIPPADPTNLQASVNGADVILDWSTTPNTETDLAGYYIYRQNGLEWDFWGDVSKYTTTYTDPSLPNGTYRYQITAYDSAYNESGPSNPVNATVAVAPPSNPPVLSVTAPPEGKTIIASWQASGGTAVAYNVYRSLTSDGGYVKINPNPLQILTYKDAGLVNGTTYFYRVTAVDAVGNESLPSNPASGVPRDMTTVQPLILWPTVAGSPFVVRKNGVTVGGFAEPASQIDIMRDGSLLGSVTASLQDVQTDASISISASAAALSSDGEVLAMVDYSRQLLLSNRKTNVTVSVPAVGFYYFTSSTLQWSPNGRFLLVSVYDYSWRNRIAIYDRDLAQIRLLTAGEMTSEWEPSWSENGDAVVLVGWDKNGMNGIWKVRIEDAAITLLAGHVGADNPKLSPAGDRMAYISNSSLYLLNITDGSISLIDDNSDWRTLEWSPDGSKLAYISYRDGDGGDFYVFSTAAGSSARLTTSGLDGYYAAWSPDSEHLAYTAWGDSGEEVVHILQSDGTDRQISQSSSDIYGLEWRKNGELIFIDTIGIHSISFAGTFNLFNAQLVPGENHLVAISTDTSGNRSTPSDPITVVFDTGYLPDLVITDSDITIFPPYPKPGEDVLVTARIHNPTANAVDNIKAELYLWDGSNAVTTLASDTILHIDANGEGTISARFNAGTAIGMRTLIAIADPDNTISELLENNNYGSKDLVVTSQELMTLATSLNAAQFAANNDLNAVVTVRNSGMTKGATMIVAVEDTAGTQVKLLDSRSLEVAYGYDQKLTYIWNTAATLAGSYRLHAVLLDGVTVLADSASLFTIMPDLRVSAGIVTDRQQYGARQDVGLAVSFKNIGVNYLIPQLRARVRVLGPQNTELFSGEQTVANLMPGATGSLPFNWNTGLIAPGPYTATLDIFAGDKLVTSSSANFNIIASVSIGGSIKAEPAVAILGSSFTANYTLTNNGNAGASGTAQVSLIDQDASTVVATTEQATILPMGSTVPGNAIFQTDGLKLKNYLLKLNFLSNGSSTVIATTPLSVKDGTPPVLTVSTLADGSLTSSTVLNIAGTVTDNVGVKQLLINGVSVPLGPDGAFSHALLLKPGENKVEVQATDLAGNSASDSRTIYQDQKAPVLVVTSPADNSKTNMQQIDVTGYVDEPSTVEVSLKGVLQPVTMDGNNFTASVTLLPGATANTIDITATNLAMKSSSVKRSVYYDDQAPALAITAPGQDIRTNQANLTIRGTASDLYGYGVTVSLDVNGQKFTPQLIDGTFEQAVTFTTEDTYHIVATATNEMNTSTSVQRNVIYDITPPAFTIDNVISPTNQQSQVISGTRDADATVTVSCATATVGPVEYLTATTWKASLSSLTVDDNTITATATDGAGNPNSLPVHIIYDSTPPTGSILINNGASFTAVPQVTLSLSAADANGVTNMRLSNDGNTWGDPEPFVSQRVWYLISGDVQKNVYVQYQDTAENWSKDPIVASIVLDTTPPLISVLPAGDIYNSTQTVKLTTNEPATIYYTTDGSTPTTLSAVYSGPLTIASSTNLNCLAKDSAGNLGTHPESYIIDTIPPVLNVSTLPNGSYTTNEVLNVSGTVTDNIGVKELLINGTQVPFGIDGKFSQALLLKSGENLVNVSATDLATNPASDNRIIYLDQKVPMLKVTAPADNIKTNKPFIDVTGYVTDESNTVVEVSLNGVPQIVSRDGNNFSATVALVPGSEVNTINIKATDLAINSSSDKRSVYYDDKSPALAITVPQQDIRTNVANLTVQGTASDPYGFGVTVSLDMNGQKFTPPLINGKFEQAVTFTTEGPYNIVATATNDAKSSTSVPRNIIYDVTPPVLSINPVVSPTNQTSQSISGTKDAGLEVIVTCTTASVGVVSYPSDTSWQVTVSGLQQGNNVITATSTDAAGNVKTATTTINFTTSQLAAIFSAAVFGTNSVNMSGGTVDSYSGTPANYIKGQYKDGNVGTNSLQSCAIQLSGGATIFGEAWVGPQGNPVTGICKSGGSSVNNIGSLTNAKNMTPLTDPSGGTAIGALQLSSSTRTLTTGEYRATLIGLSGGSTLNLIGPITLHVDGNLTLSGGSKIIVSSGSVTIYVNGQKMDISGGSIINNSQDPTNLTIYGTAGLQTANLSGGSNQYALVFAPNAAITLSGGGNTFGSIIGKSVILSGGSSVHYYEYLLNSTLAH